MLVVCRGGGKHKDVAAAGGQAGAGHEPRLAPQIGLGKRFEAHTVTWTDFTIYGEYVSSMDEVTWIVDGVTVGKGKEMAKHNAPWAAKRDMVIQVVEPAGWNRPRL